MDEPKGVLLFREHLELLNKLPCEKRCEVLDAIFAYHYDGVIPELDSLSELVFIPIRQALDRNAEKYRKRCQKNREAALKRWNKLEDSDTEDAKTDQRTEEELLDANDANASYNNNSNRNKNRINKKNSKNKESNPYKKREPNREEVSPTPEKELSAMGTFGNVYLGEEELERLKQKYPKDWEEKIENLSCYMESTGKEYKSHLAVLLSWAAKDEKKTEDEYRYAPSPSRTKTGFPEHYPRGFPKIFREGLTADIFSDEIYENY